MVEGERGGGAGKEGSLLLLTLNYWVRPGWMGWDMNYRICVHVHDDGAEEGADGEC